MKRIKLSTKYAGPAGCWERGEHEVSDSDAKLLVAAGAELLSEPVKESPEPPKPKPAEVETAEAVQEKREEAVTPKRRGRRRGR